MKIKEEERKGGSPYVAGALTGLLMVLSIWITGKYFGASTTFVRAAGLMEKQFAQERVSGMDYFIKELPKIDWQFLFVIGIFFGSLVAATTSGTFQAGGYLLRGNSGSVHRRQKEGLSRFWAAPSLCSAPAWQTGDRAAMG